MTSRQRLDWLTAEPADVLRRLRGRRRLVALTGAWHHGEALVAFEPDDELSPDDDPFEVGHETPAPADGAFGGGWLGIWGYRLGRLLEDVGPEPHRPQPQPSHVLGHYPHVLRRVGGQWWAESLLGEDVLEAWVADVTPELRGDAVARRLDFTPFSSVPSAAGHEAAVGRVLEHIGAGDFFQVNLCQRLEADYVGDPLDAFCVGIETLAPAYAAYVAWDDGAVVSLSPELFLRRIGAEVLTSPIKGTAPLAADPEELVASSKDRAENVMIVDLMRNDLGRVCEPGSVRVPAISRVERHSVWHLVSDVVGRLREGLTDADLLRATFPPGSITGAPKVRAMQVINALEPTAREAYTGAIGHISPHAGLELNVAIRTLEFRRTGDDGGAVWLGAGGGIVSDSDPAREQAECLTKADPILSAVGAVRAVEQPSRSPESPTRFAEPPTRFAEPPTRFPEPPTRFPELGEGPSTGSAQRGVGPDQRGVGSDQRGVGSDQRRVATEGPGVPKTFDCPSRAVFETVLVRDGHAVDLDAHLARLDASVRALHGTTVRAGLESAVAAKVAGLRGKHRLRIDATPAGAQAQRRVGATDVVVSLSVAELAEESATWELDVRVIPGGWGQHKWADREPLGPVVPGRDGLIVDEDGSVLESTRASLFIVLDDGVHTPPLDGRILPGTERARVADKLRARGIPVVQRRLTTADMARASEVFVTNALRGVVPVTGCPGVGQWAPGPVAGLLRGASSEPANSGPAAQVALAEFRDRTRVLFIDNYDSFVHNLAQYVGELGAETVVVRNAADVDAIVAARAAGEFTHLVISPGPGTPSDAGISAELVRRLGPTTPTLGVCLGHQVIAEVYGGKVVHADEVVHGKPSLVHHDGDGVFDGLPSPLTCARYHSLVVDPGTLPSELEVTARTASGVVMGIRHRSHPVEGVQMHPESILTHRGHDMLANFLFQDGANPQSF